MEGTEGFDGRPLRRPVGALIQVGALMSFHPGETKCGPSFAKLFAAFSELEPRSFIVESPTSQAIDGPIILKEGILTKAWAYMHLFRSGTVTL